MSKVLELNLEDEEMICTLASALSSPARIQILKLLYFNSYNVAQIAEKLDIPTSSAALYVRSLEEAGLINTRLQPGNRGSMKICSRKHDQIAIRLTSDDPNIHHVCSVSMPVGNFTDFEAYPSCGLASAEKQIGSGDRPDSFFLPERTQAQIIWSAAGYVEYKFPYQVPQGATLTRLMLSLEMCSEVLNYKDDWLSDISFWIDGIECGTWRSPGDFGGRPGILNPDWWTGGCTQYGKLVTLEISEDGTYINSEPVSNVSLKNFNFNAGTPLTLRIGNKPDAEYVGGFNIFGEKFGDYEQNILMSYEY